MMLFEGAKKKTKTDCFEISGSTSRCGFICPTFYNFGLKMFPLWMGATILRAPDITDNLWSNSLHQLYIVYIKTNLLHWNEMKWNSNCNLLMRLNQLNEQQRNYFIHHPYENSYRSHVMCFGMSHFRSAYLVDWMTQSITQHV